MASASDYHRDIQKEFENFTTSSGDERTARNLLIRTITNIIRTKPVDQSLKDIDNSYTETFGDDVASYPRNARTAYLDDVIREVKRLLPTIPVPGGKRRKTRRRRYSRRR